MIDGANIENAAANDGMAGASVAIGVCRFWNAEDTVGTVPARPANAAFIMINPVDIAMIPPAEPARPAITPLRDPKSLVNPTRLPAYDAEPKPVTAAATAVIPAAPAIPSLAIIDTPCANNLNPCPAFLAALPTASIIDATPSNADLIPSPIPRNTSATP